MYITIIGLKDNVQQYCSNKFGQTKHILLTPHWQIKIKMFVSMAYVYLSILFQRFCMFMSEYMHGVTGIFSTTT